MQFQFFFGIAYNYIYPQILNGRYTTTKGLCSSACSVFSVRIDKGIESHFLTENKEITILT